MTSQSRPSVSSAPVRKRRIEQVSSGSQPGLPLAARALPSSIESRIIEFASKPEDLLVLLRVSKSMQAAVRRCLNQLPCLELDKFKLEPGHPLTAVLQEDCKRLVELWPPLSVNVDSLTTLVARNVATLEEVDATDYVAATEALFLELARCSKLKTLSIGDLAHDLEQSGGLDKLVNGQSLATVLVINCRKVTDLKFSWSLELAGHSKFDCPPVLSTMLNSGSQLCVCASLTSSRSRSGLKLRQLTLEYMEIGMLAAIKATSLQLLEVFELKLAFSNVDQPAREMEAMAAFAAELAAMPLLDDLTLMLPIPLPQPVDFTLPNVQRFVYSGQFAPIVEKAPKLRYVDLLRLDDEEDMFTDFSRTLLRLPPNVEWLQVSRDELLTAVMDQPTAPEGLHESELFAAVAAGQIWQNLLSIEFVDALLSSSALAALSCLPNLEQLSVELTPRALGGVPIFLQRAPALRRFAISISEHKRGTFLTKFRHHWKVQKGGSAKQLRCLALKRVPDSTFGDVLKRVKFPQLIALRAPQRTARAIIKRAPELRELEVGNGYSEQAPIDERLTSDFVSALEKNCGGLTTIRAGLPHPNVLRALIDADLPELEKLQFDAQTMSNQQLEAASELLRARPALTLSLLGLAEDKKATLQAIAGDRVEVVQSKRWQDFDAVLTDFRDHFDFF